MDKRSNTTPTSVLISIYQQYADAILEGEKIIEFRKPQFPDHVSRVYLYSTNPVKKVVGYFEVESVLRESPTHLWNRYGKRGSIGREDYFKYYENNNEACGILIKKVVRFKRPVELKELDDEMTVPQSFCYLGEDKIERLEKLSFFPSRFRDDSLFFGAFRRVRNLPRFFKLAMRIS